MFTKMFLILHMTPPLYILIDLCFFKQGQTIQEVLNCLEGELHEPELWALCRECVLALARHRQELRKYTFIEYRKQ